MFSHACRCFEKIYICVLFELKLHLTDPLRYCPLNTESCKDDAANSQVDRPSATVQRCGEVASQLFDLFAQLGASEEQLDFPILYASARQVCLTDICQPACNLREKNPRCQWADWITAQGLASKPTWALCWDVSRLLLGSAFQVQQVGAAGVPSQEAASMKNIFRGILGMLHAA